MVYNPVGKILVEIARPHMTFTSPAFSRAYINLVRAQLEIRLAMTLSDRVQAFLSSAGAETRNPYDGMPFTWDAATGTLSFLPQSQRWRDWGTPVSVAPSASAK